MAINTRCDLEKDLKKFFGGAFGTKKQIKEYTNFGNNRIAELLKNVQHFGGDDAHGARWHAADIADMLWEMRCV